MLSAIWVAGTGYLVFIEWVEARFFPTVAFVPPIVLLLLGLIGRW
jgi:hypothetical protein